MPRTLIALALALATALVPFGARADEPAFEVVTNPCTFGQAPDWMPDGERVVTTRSTTCA